MEKTQITGLSNIDNITIENQLHLSQQLLKDADENGILMGIPISIIVRNQMLIIKMLQSLQSSL